MPSDVFRREPDHPPSKENPASSLEAGLVRSLSGVSLDERDLNRLAQVTRSCWSNKNYDRAVAVVGQRLRSAMLYADLAACRGWLAIQSAAAVSAQLRAACSVLKLNFVGGPRRQRTLTSQPRPPAG